MEHKYRILDGNGKFYRGEENGEGWTEVMDEAKVYDSQKELPAALLSDEGEVCIKKKIRFEVISGYTSIRYFPERSGNGGGSGGGGKDITSAPYCVIKGKVSGIREAEPDDPIYTRGFIIGGTFSRMASKRNTEPISEEEKRHRAE